MTGWGWPTTPEDLADLQRRLAQANTGTTVELPEDPNLGGCFIAYAAGEAGPGHPGDHAWAAAVVWRPTEGGSRRRSDAHLKGVVQGDAPRQARDVMTQSVVHGTVPASYAPGYLALREGPLLAAAVDALDFKPDLLLVDATGKDHPRRAGLAVHLGAVCELPTVGVTQRPLMTDPNAPRQQRRGDTTPLEADGEIVGAWVCTRTRARPVVAHAGWRTDSSVAVRVVLLASTNAARTPVPLQEARRVAREARSL